MANKGSPFERQICGELSYWWTKDKNASVFWRTAGSGGRATVRGKKGKDTSSHAGDICSTDSTSSVMTKLITMELKRGYNSKTIMDLLDCSPHSAKQSFQLWIEQAMQSSKNAKTPFWIIIHKRDRRDILVYFPIQLYYKINKELPLERRILPLGVFNISNLKVNIVVLRWSTFLDWTTPTVLKTILKRIREKNGKDGNY